MHRTRTALLLLGFVAPFRSEPTSDIPIRPIGRITARSTVGLTSVRGVRVLSDGRVLVNDQTGHKVVLFDASLGHMTIIADTNADAPHRLTSSRPAGLLAYAGDTSLIADVGSNALVLVAPDGSIGRVIAAPMNGTAGIVYLVKPSFGASFDARGSIVSKWPLRAANGRPNPFAPESAAVLRLGIANRTADTIARLLASNPGRLVADSSGGTVAYRYEFNPVLVADDWTVLADGTIAVLREHDYHIDWYSPDGKFTSSPRLAHTWEHLSDDDKTGIIQAAKQQDSVEAARERVQLDSIMHAQGRTPPRPSGPALSMEAPPPMQVTLPDGSYASVSANYIDAAKLPDYYPAFGADTIGFGAVMADADGSLWIRQSFLKPPAGGFVFDVVNRKGELTDRVQIPGGTSVVGFGRGMVYLMSRDGDGYHIARALIH